MSTVLHDRSISVGDAERWFALGAGTLLIVLGASRRSLPGTFLAASSAPLLYRGVTGRWPPGLAERFNGHDTKTALGGPRGVHVRESIRLEVPIAEVFRYWRQLDHLPQIMSHLAEVTETSNRRSHWVAEGPAGLRVEWDAEIINEVENELIGWRSLPDSDIMTAGSVNFDAVRGGRSTQLTVHLQYAPPAGKAGALIASLFGREPSQAIREDLRHFRQWLEAGEIPRATPTQNRS